MDFRWIVWRKMSEMLMRVLNGRFDMETILVDWRSVYSISVQKES